MISSVRLDGSTQCLAIQGGTTKEVFREYVRLILNPTLNPGDLVILDNLSAHKDAKVKELIESRGASIMFLPAYSPDLNPIEKMWSKVKEKIRSDHWRQEHMQHSLKQLEPLCNQSLHKTLRAGSCLAVTWQFKRNLL